METPPSGQVKLSKHVKGLFCLSESETGWLDLMRFHCGHVLPLSVVDETLRP
jgi:hypothetical protein